MTQHYTDSGYRSRLRGMKREAEARGGLLGNPDQQALDAALQAMDRAATAEALLGEALDYLTRAKLSPYWSRRVESLRTRAHDAGLLRGDE